MSAPMLRILDAQELAALPDDWDNATVDIGVYHQVVTHAFECDAATWETWVGPKQEVLGCYYIAYGEECS